MREATTNKDMNVFGFFIGKKSTIRVVGDNLVSCVCSDKGQKLFIPIFPYYFGIYPNDFVLEVIKLNNIKIKK